MNESDKLMRVIRYAIIVLVTIFVIMFAWSLAVPFLVEFGVLS